jgi:predicted DCC family thiol-disulfide oxidoreductase YuxK
LRDWLYDRIALNRYQLFGKYDTCVIPSADHLSRYLNVK